ncbi:MAG: PQQ-binding-like beta-propeller repeat protein, partial [Blastochloris sp.]|nr:PQQ-binding-like beta-propeller repeat protein [Blastochloris sp.]
RGGPDPARSDRAQGAATPAAPALYGAVDGARIIGANDEPGNWMAHGRTYDEQRYSPLRQITADNVKQMGLAWAYEMNTTRGLEASPIVVDGIIYTTGNWGVVHAIDGHTGQELWTFDPQVPGEWARYGCCDVVNRGVAVWKGKVYVASFDGRLIALDASLNIDDNALFRQDEIARMYDSNAESALVARAYHEGIRYIALSGTIGCIVNGAGLSMVTLDRLADHGGRPASLTDICGLSTDQIREAVRITLADPSARCLLVNVFGGITRADQVAPGILQGIAAAGTPDHPIFIRLMGTRADESRRILHEANLPNLHTVDSLEAVIKLAVRASQAE